MPDTNDLVVLLLFFLLPVFAAGATFLFFVRYRLHKQPIRLTRLLFGNLLVLMLISSLALFAGELYFRYGYDTTDSFGLTKTTSRWFERHFQDNNVGYRDSQDYDLQIAEGRRRVTFLGDSFTVGHGIADVEDRFGNLVRQARPDLDVHVIARAGADTGHELWTLHSLASQAYQLDLVILVYCLNDLSDIVPEWQQIMDRIYDSPKPNYFVQHSYLLNTWYYRWRSGQDPDVSNYYQFVRENYLGQVWKEQQRRLSTLQHEVETAGGRLLVVTFPFLHALSSEYAYEEVHQILDSFWKKQGVPHLDLLNTFAAHAPNEVTVNRYDAHPNEAAHAAAATAILDFLKHEAGLSEGNP